MCRKILCESSGAAKLCFVPNPGQIVSDLGVQIAESTFGASREEPREAYIMFADPKPYLVRRKKKAPWEKVEERLKQG